MNTRDRDRLIRLSKTGDEEAQALLERQMKRENEFLPHGPPTQSEDAWRRLDQVIEDDPFGTSKVLAHCVRPEARSWARKVVSVVRVLTDLEWTYSLVRTRYFSDTFTVTINWRVEGFKRAPFVMNRRDTYECKMYLGYLTMAYVPTTTNGVYTLSTSSGTTDSCDLDFGGLTYTVTYSGTTGFGPTK
jgi:hypothetical protein